MVMTSLASRLGMSTRMSREEPANKAFIQIGILKIPKMFEATVGSRGKRQGGVRRGGGVV
jgi:hypothetical protein